MAKSQQQSGTQERGEAGHEATPARSPYPPGFDPRVQATKLYKAMKGMGTDERAIFDVLRSGRSDLNQAIESEFNRMYSGTLRSWLSGDLSGSDYTKALQLLGRGDYTLAQKLNHAADGWGADEQKIFHALEIASASDLAEVKRNAALMKRLYDELNNADYQLALAFLNGEGVLAAKLLRAVDCWGTDEAAIWRALVKASDREKRMLLDQPSLMAHLRSDLNDADHLRAMRMIRGTWDNVDRLEVAMEGWGTDEGQLLASLQGLTNAEFNKLAQGTSRTSGVAALENRLETELSGALEFEALEVLHQKRLSFDPDYALSYRESQMEKLGEGALAEEGSGALIASEGRSMSAVGRLKKACHGWGADEDSIWDVCASIPAAQGQWILKHNPENVVGILSSELSTAEYFKVRTALGGGALGRIQVLRNAVEGAGTDERQIYDAMDAILREGLAAEVLADRAIMRTIQSDIDPRMNRIFVEALRTETFTPMMRLKWATARYGTDEDLVWEVCGLHGAAWYAGGQINAEVDQLLQDELSTRDYWRAIDAIRGDPQGEQERLERSKELLERERSSGMSVAIMDTFSDSGENADSAWRDYQVAYNQAHEDGQISEQEQGQLREAEDYSRYTTEQYAQAKSTFAQWASQIAITIVGIVATVLTGGIGAGPFIAALSANAGRIAGTMVLSAALKVGIHKAVEGEGYDLESMDALVDGVGAAIEGGLFIVGNLGAAKIMQGMSKTKFAGSIGGSVEKAFGGAGKRILAGGLEGSIDGSIGGMGEGLFRGLANDKTWSGGLGNAFSNISTTTLLHGGMGGSIGMGGGALFRSFGETFGPQVRKMLAARKASAEVPRTGPIDDLLVKMPDELEASVGDQQRLMEAAFETSQRNQVIGNEIADQMGIPRSPVGLKGNAFGVEDVGKLDRDSFVAKVLEKTSSRGKPHAVGEMTDMSRGRFDVDDFDKGQEVYEALKAKLEREFGANNVDTTGPRPVYKRWHILAKDPSTGVIHEWQIGTKALTEFIEGTKVPMPEGVRLHGAKALTQEQRLGLRMDADQVMGSDFHVAKYDVLDKLSNKKLKKLHGLPKDIKDQIGLRPVEARYDELMIEAGTVPRGATEPPDFKLRREQLARDLHEVLARLEQKHPGVASQLDTKLAAEDLAKAAQADRAIEADGIGAGRAEGNGPVHMQDLPWWKTGKDARVKTDVDQPALAPDHIKDGKYTPVKNAKPILSDGVVDPHAAKQGSLGNCYLIAGCAAEARANPANIKKLFQFKSDGTVDVTLYVRKSWGADATPRIVNVDMQFPTQGGGSQIYAKLGREGVKEQEVWMMLIEKALAKEAGGYGNISGGNINKHMAFGGVHELLTGNKTRYIKTNSMEPDMLLRRIQSALDDKEPIAAGTIKMEDPAIKRHAESMHIHGNHAYSIDRVDLEARTVTLQNPWGIRHPTDVSIEDFMKYYDRLDVGKSAKSSVDSGMKGPHPEGDILSAGGEVGNLGDNISRAVVNAGENGMTAMTSTRSRMTISEDLTPTGLKPGDIMFPGDHVRAMFWSVLTSPTLVSFQGTFQGQPAGLFVDPAKALLVATELDGTFITGVSLTEDALENLFQTGTY